MTALVIDGHPNAGSLCAALATRYAEAHGDATVLAVRDLAFDGNLRLGYSRRQDLEPDLERAWERILAADHLVIVAPVWWGSVPALLKGFFDRLLLPRRAYQTKANGLPEGLLAGRSGRVMVTADSPRWYLSLVGDTTVKQLRTTTLRFCGIKPVAVSRFGPVKGSSDEQRRRWLAKAAQHARADAARRNHRPASDPTELVSSRRPTG
jgi:NAD(P)H dehydrogenase (quinone)